MSQPFFNKAAKILTQPKVILLVWIIVAIAVSVKQYHNGSYNNYSIFKHTYFHALKGLNLYAAYPNEYLDTNHYGPLFSLLIAPFAVLPNFPGMTLWLLANVLFLFFAIKQLPIEKQRIYILYWIVLHEMMTAMFSFQFNISITAIIIISFALIEKEKNFWAAFFIVFGTLIKLYGIVGLAFFFFVKGKPRFILYCAIWLVVLVVLPMIFFSPQYILDSYSDWYFSIVEKQSLNVSLTSMQDISLMGMVRTISGNASIPDWPFLISGVVLFALPYLRIGEHKSMLYRLYYLASVLIFTVIFSNSSESPTYIIAFAGVGLWFLLEPRPIPTYVLVLFIFAFILTSLSPSDIFPRFIRNEYIRPYSLKALPCVLIWFVISYLLLTRKFTQKINQQ